MEIGPGRGALTRHLLARAGRVVAIEMDEALANHLRERFRGEAHLTVVHGDVLATDLLQWGPAVVAGNLPYYITSPIVRRTLEMGAGLIRAVFLVQKEVGLRLTANPGSRDYGLLTVLTRLYSEPELLFPVQASAFSPPPKVESVAVRLTPKPGALPAPDFAEFLGLCFRQKRKTLRNNLIGVYPTGLIDSLPERSRRAEQLTLEEFQEIHRKLRA